MPVEDQGLAQSIYLANMFAQRNTCQCLACQLLRKSTDGMISQVLKSTNPGGAQLDLENIVKAAGGLGGLGTEG